MIKVLVPKMPTADDLVPYMDRIDAARWYTNFGPLEIELRERLERKYGAHVVTVSSCTAGLELVYRQEYEYPHRIELPALTFSATIHAAERAFNINEKGYGWWSFCDVDPLTWTAPSVAGFGAPVDGPVVDAAAAFGEQKVAPHQTCVFSLHATKMVGAGEGGYVVTHDLARAEELRQMTNFGIRLLPGAQYAVSNGWGTNAKLSEYHAAVALASLDLYDREAWLQLHDWYAARLPSNVTPQLRPRGAYPIMAVKLPCAVEPVVKWFDGQGIETRRWYFPPLHRHPDYQHTGVALPVTDDLADHLIGLPYHLFLTEKDVSRVCMELDAAIFREMNK
jgi:dTDP-4-amino-4,6-dideoxygalactose transaminase